MTFSLNRIDVLDRVFVKLAYFWFYLDLAETIELLVPFPFDVV